ncbi:pyridoxamine 5'-phosphate oxidase family protein [Bacillus sp. SH8-8]|uniref:pyridoxamine 5'-phosphate oxidase family protein n=1 Tax=Bacillus sp. SH8-8 TaxID=2217830 RepID=UPI0034D45FD1
MDLNYVFSESLEMVNRSTVTMLGSVDEGKFPNIKAVLKLESQGIKKFWFNTNTSSKRIQQYKDNPKACLYFLESEKYVGLMLIGNMEIIKDRELKAKLWRSSFEEYYPMGIDDPEYSILCFTSLKGKYYDGAKNIDFSFDI